MTKSQVWEETKRQIDKVSKGEREKERKRERERQRKRERGRERKVSAAFPPLFLGGGAFCPLLPSLCRAAFPSSSFFVVLPSPAFFDWCCLPPGTKFNLIKSKSKVQQSTIKYSGGLLLLLFGGAAFPAIGWCCRFH